MVLLLQEQGGHGWWGGGLEGGGPGGRFHLFRRAPTKIKVESLKKKTEKWRRNKKLVDGGLDCLQTRSRVGCGVKVKFYLQLT